MPQAPRRGLQLTALVTRALRAPGAAARRQAELERRDDVSHHLLVNLHERVADLAAQVDRLQASAEALGRAQQQAGGDLARIEGALAEVATATSNVTTDLARIALLEADRGAPVVADGPLVSVIMPTWRRAGPVVEAIRSVQAQSYPRWELIVVDDGSDDGTDAAVGALAAADRRVRYLPVEHGGVGAARNAGLAAAEGDLVAYLDSDNTWSPTHLARHVAALLDRPDATWSVSGQVVVDQKSGRAHVRQDLMSVDQLIESNFIDLNVVAHRREVLDAVGRFDVDLPRLGDWDLVLRLAAVGPPTVVPQATVRYRVDVPDRITDTEPLHHVRHRVRTRHLGRPAGGLRVLMAEWHHPQVTETYISTMAAALVALGAHVEVWAEEDPAVDAGTDLVVHRESLDEAIEAARPDLVLTHWLHQGEAFRPVTRRHGLPHVVRAHGFEHDPAVVDRLLRDDGVFVHTFPHFVEQRWLGHPRLSAEVTCFDDERFAPSPSKDRRLVLRAVAGLHTKDLDTFLLASTLCPDHEFVLVVGHSLHLEAVTEEYVARAEGTPCRVMVDVGHAEVAELFGRAGIYLHTHGTDHALGMPISVAEAMATGSHVLARDLPGMAAYLGGAGALYGGADPAERAERAAALVRATLEWSDADWDRARRRAVEQAFSRHAGREVAERMLRSWRATFPTLPGPPPPH